MRINVQFVPSQFGDFWQSDAQIYAADDVLCFLHAALRSHMMHEWDANGGLWACANPRNGVLRLIIVDKSDDVRQHIIRLKRFIKQKGACYEKAVSQ